MSYIGFFRILRKYRVLFLLTVAVFAIAGALFGYRSAEDETYSEKKQSEFEEQLAKKDSVIADTGSAVAELDKMISSLGEYTGESTYMKLDPNAICAVNSQFVITYGEGTVSAPVTQSLLAFIKDGSLKEQLAEYGVKEAEYLGDVLSASVTGSVLDIALLHYDQDLAEEEMRQIETALMDQIPDIAAVTGAFSLEKLETSAFVKADLSVLNSQNSSRDKLRGYRLSRCDAVTKLASAVDGRTAMVLEREKEIRTKTGWIPVLKWAFLGLLTGCFVCVIADYVIFFCEKEKEELRNRYGIPVIARIGKEGCCPEADRVSLELRLFLQVNGLQKTHVQYLGKNDNRQKDMKKWQEMFPENDFEYTEGAGSFEEAEDLARAFEARNCILLIDRTADDRQFEKAADVMKRFGIQAAGCILMS